MSDHSGEQWDMVDRLRAELGATQELHKGASEREFAAMARIAELEARLESAHLDDYVLASDHRARVSELEAALAEANRRIAAADPINGLAVFVPQRGDERD